MSQLRQRIAEFDSLDAELVVISPDNKENTIGLVGRLELPYPVLSDPDLRVIDAFGVRHVSEPYGKQIPRPATFVMDRDWRVRFAYVGDSVPDRPAEDVMLDAVRSVIKT